MRRDQLRDRMGAAACREAAEPAGDRPRPAEPKVRAYKGTFELPRPAARQLRLAALEHDTSITRLLEAAALVMLDDPAMLKREEPSDAPGRPTRVQNQDGCETQQGGAVDFAE